jgi:hypothetical protein
MFVPFEFTIQKCVLAKLNMVIWTSLYIRFIRSPFSRPIYNENALRERIKAFFFNLCDTVRTSYTRIYILYVLYYIIATDVWLTVHRQTTRNNPPLPTATSGTV